MAEERYTVTLELAAPEGTGKGELAGGLKCWLARLEENDGVELIGMDIVCSDLWERREGRP